MIKRSRQMLEAPAVYFSARRRDDLDGGSLLLVDSERDPARVPNPRQKTNVKGGSANSLAHPRAWLAIVAGPLQTQPSATGQNRPKRGGPNVCSAPGPEGPLLVQRRPVAPGRGR